jgi:hypothetical protein
MEHEMKHEMEYTFEVGQEVMWSGGWGTQPPKAATIVGIGEKSGRAVYDLSNGHWAYDYQLQVISEDFPQEACRVRP